MIKKYFDNFIKEQEHESVIFFRKNLVENLIIEFAIGYLLILFNL